jgi:scyllo-inositol 2-dehydrogenase (NADP+)
MGLASSSLSHQHGDQPLDAPIRVGVIGFGLGGRVFHSAVVRAVPGLQLATIVQRRGSLAAETYPEVHIARSIEEMLGDASIQLVAVATPSPTHFAVARQCLAAGKSVVVDKPIAVTSAEVEELIALARAKGVLLSAFQNRRWDGDFLTLKKLIAENAVGRVVGFESHFDRFRPAPKPEAWKDSGEAGGGILYDLGSHLIDQALDLFGEPQKLFADVRVERDGARIEDAFDTLLYYPKLTVLLRATSLAAIPAAHFTLRGTRGAWVKYGLDPQEDAIRRALGFDSPATANPAALFAEPWGYEDESAWGTLQVEGKEPKRIPTERGDYRAYYANVRDALLGKAPLAVTAEQAWRTTRIIELAHASSAQGRAVDVDFGKAP